MPPLPNPRSPARPRPRVLCVDDEPQVLESLRDTLRRRFEVVTTTNGFEALRILADEPCEVVLTDMRMPLINGARFLTLAREHAPDAVRLLLTGQSTLDDAVAAVNDGEIFRFLIKPCPTAELIEALDSAVTRHELAARERETHEQALQGTLRALIDLAAAVDPTGPRRAERLLRHAVELATVAEGVAPTWELERACELVQLGAVSLPREALTQLAMGSRLARAHAAEVERLPELAAPFVREIPRLEPVAALLSAAGDRFVATRPGVAGTPPAARVLRIVLDFEVLERQDVPAEAAMRSMQSRADRYDGPLLAAFAQMLRIG